VWRIRPPEKIDRLELIVARLITVRGVGWL
jgi:hypothetical protein